MLTFFSRGIRFLWLPLARLRFAGAGAAGA
jgi:hypothetical protein